MAGIFDIKLFSELDGQGIMNRFFYLMGSGATAEDATSAFIAAILPEVIKAMSSRVEITGVSARNETDSNDVFISLISNLTGIQSADSLPPFMNSVISLISNYAPGRMGRKSFSGLSEANVVYSDYLADFRDDLVGIADVLKSQYDVTMGGETYRLIPMLKHQVNTTGFTYGTIIASGVNPPSTQNSRKSYKGGGAIRPNTVYESFTYNTLTKGFDKQRGGSLDVTFVESPNYLYPSGDALLVLASI